jgi:PAS domain-containing protein
MRNLLAMLSSIDTPENREIRQLRDRVSELEEENLNLRKLDEILRKTLRLFDLVLAKSHEGIVLVTPDLVVLRLIHSAVGYQETEVSGQTVLSLIHPDDVAVFQKTFSELVNGQAKSAVCEFRIRQRDESYVQIAGEMTDLLDDPDVQAILLNVRAVAD